MAHLSGFGLENFRVFKEYTWFDFAPITLLVGPNNSGKTSLIKALLLLKDNYEKNLISPAFRIVDVQEKYTSEFEKHYEEVIEANELQFRNDLHGLNGPKSCITIGNESAKMSFSLPYLTSSKFRYGFFKEHQKVHYHISFNFDKHFNKLLPSSYIDIRNCDGKSICFISNLQVYLDIELYNSVINREDQDILPKYGYSKVLDIVGHPNEALQKWFLKNNYSTNDAKRNALLVMQTLVLGELSFSRSFRGPLKALSYLHYLSTSKNEQKRVYTNEDKTSFKDLLVQYNEASKFSSQYGYEEFVARSFKRFNINEGVSSNYDEEKGIFFPNIKSMSLVNFGFGYSQIASLIYQVVASDFVRHEPMSSVRPCTLLLEEPEANLHPKFQSLLANFLADAYEIFDMNFLIETHSEYMIRKFQYLVAKGEMKPEDIAIYYFHDPDNIPKGEKQIKKISIFEDGSLSDDFGPGFFDEAANLELELLKLKRNKARQN